MVGDVIFIIIYYLIGYRRKVVLSNLAIALPDKKERELKSISKKSYRHFVDIFMEMIKAFTISKPEMDLRFRFANPELLAELAQNGKSIALVGGHYGNWEWVFNINAHVPHCCIAAFTPVSNTYFNRSIKRSREKFGTLLVPTKELISTMEDHNKRGILSMYGLLSDQSPSLRKTFYWSEFFGVKVPVHTGAEMLAKKFDLNVVMMETRKLKRGYYETTFSLITDHAREIPDYDITDNFLRRVEQLVQSDPQYYLWTHKRFKHSDKAPSTDK
jgi:KDO2-lipid IV(A) lauroyltransferase